MLSNLAFSNVVSNTNLSQQNAVSNQQSSNEVGTSVVGSVVNSVTDLGPLQAMSALEILTGNSVSQELIDVKAAMQLPTGGGGHKPKTDQLHPWDPGYSQKNSIPADQPLGIYVDTNNVVNAVSPDGNITKINVTETP